MVVTGRPASADALRRQRPSNSNPQSPRDVGHELLRRHSGRLESPTIQAAQRNALFFQQVSRRPTIDDALPSSEASKLERTALMVGKIMKRREKLLTEYTRSFSGGDEDDDDDE